MGCHNGWSFWQTTRWREIHVSVPNYSRISWKVGIIHYLSYLLYISILQPNLDREDSNVSFKTKVLHFFVLFTCRQVTKSNWINLTDFGPRQNVKVPKPLNPCCDISAQLHFLLIITECILSYWIRADLIVIPESHSGSNSTLRSLTTIIWSLESLWRRKEQSKWEETVHTMLRSRCRRHSLDNKTSDHDKLLTKPKPRVKLTFVD